MNSKSPRKRLQLIYIAGYGHSGSTILETLVCCPDNIIGLGELVGIPRELNASFTKIFMENYPKCRDLYRNIENALEIENETLKSISELNKLEHLLNFHSKRERNRYNKFWTLFFDTAVSHSNASVSIITDASKTALAHAKRPYYLQNLKDVDVKMIHIIRHPRSVIGRYRSKRIYVDNVKGHQRLKEFFRVVRTSLNWTFSNIWPALNSKRVHKYVRISFEELCDKPAETIRRIQDTLEIDMSDTIRRLDNNEPLSATCGIAGNIPVKKKDRELKFQPSKKSVTETGFTSALVSIILMPVYSLLTK